MYAHINGDHWDQSVSDFFKYDRLVYFKLRPILKKWENTVKNNI